MPVVHLRRLPRQAGKFVSSQRSAMCFAPTQNPHHKRRASERAAVVAIDVLIYCQHRLQAPLQENTITLLPSGFPARAGKNALWPEFLRKQHTFHQNLTFNYYFHLNLLFE